MLTNEGGEAVGKFTYSAYGQLSDSSGSQTTPLGYAGQLTNEQSGLLYMRARVYDSVTGQFMTRDPIEALTRQPYAYALDNPLAYVDPRGLGAGELELPCWPFCLPPPEVVEGLEKLGKATEDVVEKAFQDQIPYDPRLGETEEHQLEIGECRAEEFGWLAEGRKEMGDARQALDRATQQVEKLGHSSGPPGGPRWKGALALLGELLARLFQHRP